jgi:hypothetical protein
MERDAHWRTPQLSVIYINNMSDKNNIHEDFRHYRNSGIALSVTLISLSSALIIWGSQILEREDPSSYLLGVSLIISSAVTIFLCLSIQIFHYIGYKIQARDGIGQTDRNPNSWFTAEDWSFGIAIVSFIVSVIISAVIFKPFI